MTFYIKMLIIFIFMSLIIPISSAVGPIPDTNEIFSSWSPDGQKIIFISYGPMSQGIFIVKPDGSDLQKISSDGWNPSWSPDGTKIVLTQVFENNNSINQNVEISLLAINTRNVTRLTYGGAKKSVPKFSADGKKIVFESYDNYIYFMNSDGTNMRKIAEFARFPEWSPDGQKIVYRCYEPNSIWVVNPDGTDKKNVFDDYKYTISSNFRWTPDSNYLLLNNHSNTITKVNISNPTDIEYIYDPVAHWNPEYSPDGNYVTFVSSMDGGNPDLFVARSNGSDLHRLVYDTNPQTPFDPGYFGKIDRPTPPPWPTPEPSHVVTSTVEPANISAAEQTSSIPGFSALAVFVILVSLASIKRRK